MLSGLLDPLPCEHASPVHHSCSAASPQRACSLAAGRRRRRRLHITHTSSAHGHCGVIRTTAIVVQHKVGSAPILPAPGTERDGLVVGRECWQGRVKGREVESTPAAAAAVAAGAAEAVMKRTLTGRSQGRKQVPAAAFTPSSKAQSWVRLHSLGGHQFQATTTEWCRHDGQGGAHSGRTDRQTGNRTGGRCLRHRCLR